MYNELMHLAIAAYNTRDVDDTPRLALADYLQEMGQDEGAKLLRDPGQWSCAGILSNEDGSETSTGYYSHDPAYVCVHMNSKYGVMVL